MIQLTKYDLRTAIIYIYVDLISILAFNKLKFLRRSIATI
jgi:hypothetical protein